MNTGPTPYGFDVLPPQLVENKKEQRAIAHMCRLREAGHSLRQIAEWLDRHGYPSPRGGKWNSMSVKQIIDREQAK